MRTNAKRRALASPLIIMVNAECRRNWRVVTGEVTGIKSVDLPDNRIDQLPIVLYRTSSLLETHDPHAY